jgi:hypothetical protein
VHDLGDLAVDGAWRELQVVPELLPFGRRALRREDLAVGLAELLERLLGHVGGDLGHRTVGDGHAEVTRDDEQLLLVADDVVGRLTGAAASSVRAMSRPWSECAATPPATWRAK